MCAIFGISYPRLNSIGAYDSMVHAANRIWNACRDRGRDGSGYGIGYNAHRWYGHDTDHTIHADELAAGTTLIGNRRAEPTTEYVKDKVTGDQQPYILGNWSIVHNGTIANDKALRTGMLATKIDSAAVVEALVEAEHNHSEVDSVVEEVLSKLVGSYALLIVYNPTGALYAACNYRPIWVGKMRNLLGQYSVFFASSRSAFEGTDMVPAMQDPYSISKWNSGRLVFQRTLRPSVPDSQRRALVVCSGGLDSVVAARMAQSQYGEVELIHFLYGSRAEKQESDAIIEIANRLGVSVKFMPIPDVYDESDSPLLRPDSGIAGGEKGAEYAHEWVPARNLVMLSIATAYAEANGFTRLVLGNNLEEAGAYPDNEPEFIDRFNDMAAFAVGDGKELRVEMPVGNMMKHEIVAVGLKLDAPLDLTWSCYRNGEKHCGRCGPCFMRRTAFDINGATEVIQYEA